MSKSSRRLAKVRKSDYFADILFRAGLLDMVRRLERNSLTVLCYHRIGDSTNGDLSSYQPNISATSANFAQQMDYLKQNYNVISCSHLAEWLRGERELGSHPAIVTFDDGYKDNFSYAHPILFERGLPSTVFLTTNFIGPGQPFYWDVAAYCFYHTKKTTADLPGIGRVRWTDHRSRERVINLWVNLVKKLPDGDKNAAVWQLSDVLNVPVPENGFSGLSLTWDQVREMVSKGFEIGSHTLTHPILTRIPTHQLADELAKSKKIIEAETGTPVTSFAYPNGQVGDFSSTVIRSVKEAGYEVAFTLLPGPASLRSVRNAPLVIKRIFIGYSCTFPRFVAKLSGFDIVQSMFDNFRG